MTSKTYTVNKPGTPCFPFELTYDQADMVLKRNGLDPLARFDALKSAALGEVVAVADFTITVEMRP